MKISSENIDEILFDYFEGNLSASEKNSVKLFLDENPEYLEDFRIWEVSNARHYTLDNSIDTSLLKPATTYWLRDVSFLCFDLLILGTFVFSIQQDSSLQTTKQSEKERIVISNEKNRIPTAKEKSSVSISSIIKSKKRVPEMLLLVEHEAIIIKDSSNEVILNTPPILVSVSDTLVDETSDKILIEEVKKEKEILSRKEERRRKIDIQKFKQKEKDKRNQNEFLKGNQPYVVPINPNGF